MNVLNNENALKTTFIQTNETDAVSLMVFITAIADMTETLDAVEDYREKFNISKAAAQRIMRVAEFSKGMVNMAGDV